jgi:hypothetical protein
LNQILVALTSGQDAHGVIVPQNTSLVDTNVYSGKKAVLVNGLNNNRTANNDRSTESDGSKKVSYIRRGESISFQVGSDNAKKSATYIITK